MSSTTAATRQWRLSRRELFLIFLFWTALATLSSVNRLLDPRGFGFRGISPVGPIELEFMESWLWAAVTPLVFWLAGRFDLEQSPRAVRIALLLAAGVAISIVIYLLLAIARVELFETIALHRRRPPMFAPFRDIARFRFLNHFLVYIAVLVAGYAREYFVRDQVRVRQAAALESRTALLSAQLADARLDALRMQLNPHFLFNTLHAIAALVERDPSGVRRMIARLSELLRLTMDNDAEHEVPLREELDFLRRYIEIMEIRFQGQLRMDINVAPEVLAAFVPRLILQPIVENAFEHGAARAAGEAKVELAAHRNGGSLVISVADNGPGVTAGSPAGVGLTNTRARLAQLYGESAALTVTSRGEGGARAEIVLPFRESVDG